ncbi:Serine active site containing protein 1 [Xylographa trunciseda]|nr:Serine active site containing protein 1 [Xylographa trunciseda]
MSIVSKNFLRVLVNPDNATLMLSKFEVWLSFTWGLAADAMLVTSIVAVHGLNPAEATWTSGDKLWLRDFLPQSLLNARVLLFGYNFNVAFDTSIAGVREQATNLLNRIESKREGAEDRPIIFVTHSLGGIIVKRALVEAKLDDTYKSIRDATYGIAFFSTPHQRGNFVKLGDIAASIVRGVLRNPSNSFLEVLTKDSLFSNNLADDFRHSLEEYHILSFFETLPMGKFGLIVDKKSATLGLPGLRERQIPMDADHASVCKYASADDNNYEQVSFNLVRLVKNAVKDAAERARLAHLSVPVSAPLLEPAYLEATTR